MIAVSAVCAFLLGSVLSASGGTWRDDFEDGDFEGWTTLGGEWSIKDGVVVCKNGSSDVVILFIGEPTWRNYTVTFDGKVESHSGRYSIGGLVRYDEVKIADAYYCIGNEPVGGGERAETGIVAGGKFLGIVRDHNFSLKVGKWSNFRTHLDGTKIDFFLDNELAISTDYSNQPIPPSGKFALWTRFTDEAHFDNVVITGDDIRPIQPKSKLTNTWGRIKQAD